MLPYTEKVWSDIEYARQYGGEEKLMSEFLEYEKITGKDWAEALLAFDPVSQNMENFHKKVVIPVIAA